MKNLRFCILGILLLLLTISFCQTQFRCLNVEDGLSQSSVVAIAQDSSGYLWFATQDGLNRYYGNFEIFDRQFDDITRENYFTLGKLFVDHLNQVWLISKSGKLERYIDGSFHSYDQFIGVQSIFQDQKYNYWIYNNNGDIIKLDQQMNIDTLFNFQNVHIQTHVLQNEKNIVFGTNKGIIVLDQNNNTIKPSNSFKQYNISHIDTEADCILFSTFSNVIYKTCPKKEKSVVPVHTLPMESVIYNFYKDRSGRFWIGTYGDGLYMIPSAGEPIQHFFPDKRNQYSFSYHDVLDIYEDANNVIWFGTDGGGVSYYDEYLQKFKLANNTTLPKGIDIDVVRSISADGQKMYLGTSGKGLTVFDKSSNQWNNYNTSNGLKSDRIMSIHLDSDQSLWLGSQFDGLSKVIFENGNISSVETFLDSTTIWTIHKTPEEKYFWLGGLRTGLLKFDPSLDKVFSSFPKGVNYSTFNVRSIIPSGNQSLLVGTDEYGVFFYDIKNDTWSPLYDEGPKKIKALYLKNNLLFISTNGKGVWVWDNKKKKFIKNIGVKDGLANKVVYAILPGKENEYWASTNRGISQIFFEVDKPLTIKNYGLSRGLQSLEFNTGAYFQDNNQNIYFGGVNGVNWFDPIQSNPNPFEPRVVIHDVQSQNVSYSSIDGMIKLPLNKNTIEFHVSGMHHSLPAECLYKYRLSGFEKTWSISKEQIIRYMNLPAGEYSFECRAINYDGLESSNVAAQKIYIQQHWYLTTWFKLFVLGLIAFSIYKIRSVEKTALQLKLDKEKEIIKLGQMKELDSMRKRLFTNISHEIRTPLTVIVGLTKRIKSNDKIKQAIDLNSKNLLQLLNQILKISKIESGGEQLEESEVDIISYLEMLTESFTSLANDKSISLNFYSESKKQNIEIDKLKLKQIIENLISNAIKYTPEYGKVMLIVKLKEEHLNIKVRDSGIGISKEDQQNIFKRFYQVKSTDPEISSGVGIGLSLVNDLVNLMGGNINLTSTKGEGSSFELTLPYKKVSIEKSLAPQLLSNEKSNEKENTILIIDDNKDILFYMEEVLKSKYNLLKAMDGQTGIQIAQKEIPDLIITDIMMPGMDGISMTKFLKDHFNTSHIPIIVVSAKNQQESRIQGFSAGADAYLIKPFDEEELLVRIASLLQMRKRAQGEFNLKTSSNLPKENKFLSTVNKVISENLSDPNLDIQTICQAVNLERSQLYRKLKAISGKSALELIVQARMEKASHHLLETNNTIKEISFMVGYLDESYFSRLFKKYFDLTPTAFKQKNKK